MAKRKYEKNNYQDAAMEREFEKGEKAASGKGGRKMSRRGKTREKSTGTRVITPVTGLTAGDNDPSFYIPNAQMAKDVLSLPESINAGRPVKIRNGSLKQALSSNLEIPGVLVFRVLDTIPSGTGGIDSPINRAGSDLYQAIQAANSRSPQYGMPLLMMYVIAHGSLLGLYEFICRAYGTAHNFSYMDSYTPGALITAMEVDYPSLKGNLAETRTQINQLAEAMSSLVIPAAFKYLDRQVWLYSGIYRDSDTAKAQYYMYNPIGFFKWIEGQGNDPAGHPGLTYLSFISNDKLPSAPNSAYPSLQSYINLAWEMLNALRNSEDIRNIGSDLIKAFGMGKMYRTNPIAETFSVTPSYNKEVLAQMENAFIYPNLSTAIASDGSVSTPQVEMSIIQNPGINGTNIDAQTLELYNLTLNVVNGNIWSQMTDTLNEDKAVWTEWEPDQYILNFHDESVTSDLLLTSSRFTTAKPLLPLETPNQNAMTIQPETTAIICGAYAYYYEYNDNGSLVLQTVPMQSYNLSSINSATISSSVRRMLEQTKVWSTFDWMPKIQFISYTGSATPGYKTGLKADYMWDIDNYYQMGKNLMSNVNYMANVGLFQPRGLAGTAQS